MNRIAEDGKSPQGAVTEEYRVQISQPLAARSLGTRLLKLFEAAGSDQGRSLVFVCIGTDRSTGDSLGPIVGTKLQELRLPGTHVFGCLESPVHATNLAATMKEISRQFSDAVIVALDACLGSVESVGTVSVGMGALKPGAGVNKKLPPVGDIYLTGVVNIGGFMEYFVLQNTRLSLVMKMARVITQAIQNSVESYCLLYSKTGELAATACLEIDRP